MSDETKRPALSITWLGAYAVGVPYMTGYIIVTIHLANFNVSPADLIRLQYIVAGVWSLLPLLVVVYPVVWLAAFLDHTYRGWGRINVAGSWRKLLIHAGRIS